MTSTQKNLLLVAAVGAIVIPGMYLFYMWSSRIDGRTKPEVRCLSNLSLIDTAEQAWALQNKNTTNDTPTWTELHA